MSSSVKILVVTGSVRPNSTNQTIVDHVISQLRTYDNVEASIADVGKLALPFFDASMPPSSSTYTIPHESVKRWSDMVSGADAVIFAMPEYNRAMTALQKNAIDWLYTEWSGKTVGIVAYGFHQGRRAVANFESINANIGAKLIEPVAHLQYGQQLSTTGEIIQQKQCIAEIGRTLDAVIQNIRDA